MLIAYRHAHCPVCGGYHDPCMRESTAAMVYHAHQFICPIKNQTAPWRPDVFAHVVEKFPPGAIPLVTGPEKETPP
jgi:hypothetical protein